MFAKILSKILKKKIPIDNDYIYFTFSGRTALNILAKALAKRKRTALIPSYVCNVVHKAFEIENYKIITYRINDKFEPDIDAIVKIIEENEIDVVLFASIYGSGEFLDELHNTNSTLYKLIREKKVEVIIDFAQDLYQIYNLPKYDKNYHYFFSFNDKSFMSVMGGMIVSKLNLDSGIGLEKLSIRQKILILAIYLLKLVNCKASLLLKFYKETKYKVLGKPRLIESPYDYSECASFPYTFNNYKISGIQLLFAIIGFSLLPKYKKKKERLIRTLEGKLVKTKFINTAAYVALKEGCPLHGIHNKVKKSYARLHNKCESEYPNLVVIHNKGFCDT